MESGHSFLPNDTDFGKIEKRKNLRENIYTFSHWVNLIRDCKFSVYHMKGKFLNISKLVETHTFRQNNCAGVKFNWLKLKWLRICKSNPTVMEYRTTHDLTSVVESYDFSIRKNLRFSERTNLETLYPVPVKISSEKYNDLISLLPFVPEVYHSYFRQLPFSGPNKKQVETHPDIIEETGETF